MQAPNWMNVRSHRSTSKRRLSHVRSSERRPMASVGGSLPTKSVPLSLPMFWLHDGGFFRKCSILSSTPTTRLKRSFLPSHSSAKKPTGRVFESRKTSPTTSQPSSVGPATQRTNTPSSTAFPSPANDALTPTPNPHEPRSACQAASRRSPGTVSGFEDLYQL